MFLSKYTIITNNNNNNAILFNGCTGAIDIVSSEVADYLKRSSNLNSLDKSLRRQLYRRGHLVDKNNNQEELVHHLRRHLNQRNLQTSGFFLIPTYSCQMHCYYCCQQSRQLHNLDDDVQKMSTSMVDAAFLAMRKLNSNGIRSLNLYGGEPFQMDNYELIRYIVDCSQRERYLLAAITNGLECESFMDLIGPSKIQGVCFSMHDFVKDEEWQRLASNVKNVLSREAFVAIRINVDPKKIKKIADFFQKVQDCSWYNHPRVSWNVCPILPPSFPPQFEILQPEDYESSILNMLTSKLIPSFVEFDLSAGRQLRGILDSGIPNPIHPRSPLFCGSKQGIFVFDPYGDIYTCHEAVNNPSSAVGKYFPILSMDKELLCNQAQWDLSLHQNCLNCPYILLCNGGCIHRDISSPSDRNKYYCHWMDVSIKLALRNIYNGIPQFKYDWL